MLQLLQENAKETFIHHLPPYSGARTLLRQKDHPIPSRARSSFDENMCHLVSTLFIGGFFLPADEEIYQKFCDEVHANV